MHRLRGGEVGSTHAGTGDATPVAADGTPFIAMEFIEGETLAAWLARAGRLGCREALDVAVQVAEGLAEAHARKIVHCDLKPQNIMITPTGRVKIVDFGLAKALRAARKADALVTTSEMISADLGDKALIGTCAYMSPEQAASTAVDPRSDVFAFGIILYQMLAGRLPFWGDTPTVILAKILEAEPDPLPVPPGSDEFAALARIIHRCLEKSPERRYADARLLLPELEHVRRASPRSGRILSIVTRRWGTSAPSRDPSPRVWLLKAVLPVILLILIGTLGYTVVQRRSGLRPSVVPIAVSTPRADPPVDSPASALSTASERHDQASATPDAAPRVGQTRQVQPGIQSDVSPDRPIERPATKQSDASPPEARAPTAPPDPRNIGLLILDSDPQSSVSLDGKLAGITPLKLEARPGLHGLVMTSPDGLRWRGTVEVTGGATNRIHRRLNATGQLSITSDVWVEVSVDGGQPEQTPVQLRLAAGLHDLRAFRQGFVTQTLEIVIEEGKTNYLRLQLEKSQ
jgi:serine/threonine protein kinase